MANVDASIDREQTMLAVVRQYFVSADAGHANVLDLFTDDVQIYFPKFGVATGKAAFRELATGLLGSLKSIAHYIRTSSTSSVRIQSWSKARPMGRTAKAPNGAAGRRRAEGFVACSSSEVR
jgi:SnoaL-like domain